MAFRFRAEDATVQAGLRRIAREQIDEALATIRAEALSPEKIVHQVRRSCKALRALIRIVRPVFPRYTSENQAFREIGHLLAGARDARVLEATLEAIVGDRPDLFDAATIAQLRPSLTGHGGEIRRIDMVLDEAAHRLMAARVRVARWTLGADGWDALSGGVSRTYREARRSMHVLAREDRADLSHEWRKQVKYHGFHMRLLRDIGPAMQRRERRADKLAGLLGDRHDMDMLVHILASRPWSAGDLPVIDQLSGEVRKRAQALGASAHKLGAALFDRKTAKLAERWGQRWKDRARETEPA